MGPQSKLKPRCFSTQAPLQKITRATSVFDVYNGAVAQGETSSCRKERAESQIADMGFSLSRKQSDHTHVDDT